jgi:hypothetical protein
MTVLEKMAGSCPAMTMLEKMAGSCPRLSGTFFES